MNLFPTATTCGKSLVTSFTFQWFIYFLLDSRSLTEDSGDGGVTVNVRVRSEQLEGVLVRLRHRPLVFCQVEVGDVTTFLERYERASSVPRALIMPLVTSVVSGLGPTCVFNLALSTKKRFFIVVCLVLTFTFKFFNLFVNILFLNFNF